MARMILARGLWACNRIKWFQEQQQQLQLSALSDALTSGECDAQWQRRHRTPAAGCSRSFAAGAGKGSGGGSGSGREERDASLGFVRGGFDLADFPPERVRNFSIVAHIDHGKSTLSDALLRATGAVPAGARPQYLDRLQVERERGITVKAQAATLVYRHPRDGLTYLLNLIDTPGHVDFGHEVGRALAACQGALLVVDAAQGVEAQTVATYHAAAAAGLALVPVLSKVDLPAADPDRVASELAAAFGFDPASALRVSAKTGAGVADALLPAIVDRIPPPRGDPSAPLRALVLDAAADGYRGATALVAVVDGCLPRGARLSALTAAALPSAAGSSTSSTTTSNSSSKTTGKTSSKSSSKTASSASSQQQQQPQQQQQQQRRECEALEVGVSAPEPYAQRALSAGTVGYVVTGVKDAAAAPVAGDTWHLKGVSVAPLPGFRPARPMVFAGLYPAAAEDYEQLAAAIARLALNDPAVTVRKESSDALGSGFRCGFLGPLHAEVFYQRLESEHGAAVVSTPPMVPYVVEVLEGGGGGGSTTRRVVVESVAAYPKNSKVLAVYEPTVAATIIAPNDMAGAVMALATARRGELLEHSFLGGGSGGGGSGSSGSGGGEASGSNSGSGGGGAVAAVAGRALLRYRLPLAELAGDFYDALKAATHGLASFDYDEEPEPRLADLSLVELLVNGAPVDALSRIAPKRDAVRVGRALAGRLKDALERQQFEVVVQAVADGRVVAREVIRAARKDVLAKCYGGDVSRKRKLLEKQKEGKRRLRALGAVSVPAEALPALMRAL